MKDKAPTRSLEERRRRAEIQRQADALVVAHEAEERRNATFEHVHRILPNASPDTRRIVAEQIGDDHWTHLKTKINDRRYANGDDRFRPAQAPKPKPAPVPRRRPSPSSGADVTEAALEQIRSLTCDAYLPALAGVDALPGGRCRCPLPNDHEDRHPSASWSGRVWFCHACGQGGDLIDLASEITGISTTGPDFIELLKWIADRLLAHADDVRASLDRRAA